MKKRIRGFTLIEVILSMAIIGIIAISFLTVMATSLRWIISAGNKTTAVNQGKADADTQLSDTQVIGTDTYDINVSGITGAVQVEGSYYTEEVTINGESVTIIVFAPNR